MPHLMNATFNKNYKKTLFCKDGVFLLLKLKNNNRSATSAFSCYTSSAFFIHIG